MGQEKDTGVLNYINLQRGTLEYQIKTIVIFYKF